MQSGHHLPAVTTRQVGRGRGVSGCLREMEDAFFTSEVNSEPLTIDKTVFRQQEDDNVHNIPGLAHMPAVIRETAQAPRGV